MQEDKPSTDLAFIQLSPSPLPRYYRCPHYRANIWVTGNEVEHGQFVGPLVALLLKHRIHRKDHRYDKSRQSHKLEVGLTRKNISIAVAL